MKTNSVLDRVVFPADCNLLDDLPKVDGFLSLYVPECDKVLWLLDSRTGQKLDSPEDFLSVSQTIALGKAFDWMPRTTYIRIVTAGQAPVFAGDPAAFDAIAQDKADFRNAVSLSLEAKAAVSASREPRARILAKNFAASRQSIEVQTPKPAMVVVCQAFRHDWQARIDGRRVAPWRAGYAFQAVEAPAGRHRILLEYKDMALGLGG